MIGIYKITNNITGKSYVGSSKNIKGRFSDHKKTLRSNRHRNIHLQRSFNLYGEESFRFEILEECSLEDLPNREIFYMNTFNSLDKNFGYNLTDETRKSKCTTSIPVYKFNMEGKLVREYDSLREASVEEGYDRRYLRSFIDKLVVRRGFFWSYSNVCNYTIQDIIKRDKLKYTNLSKRVIRIGSSGDEVEYESLNAAAYNVGGDSSTICKVCKGKKLTHKGYKWRYVDK